QGLARAATIAQADPDKTVLLVVVELCGLTFRRSDSSSANIVATALFGDGAAAALLRAGENGPRLEFSGEFTWPDSLDIMGWRVGDDGLGVVFSRDIPSLTRQEFGDVARSFLEAKGLRLDDIDQFVCHPGGAKVLDALEVAFQLQQGGLAASRQVLQDYGNMSAVTVFFVLDQLLKEKASGRYLLSSLGPGFTAAFQTMLV
ncbi:MAG: type III polyketide synthase, partial [Proteobacteria bacterium]|nr:type III polyketide synthase [Pseudomonadota bacterium]